MKKRTAFCIFFAFVLSALFCISAAALEQGYIFELKENADEDFYRLAAQQTALSEENGVYLTTDASLIFELRRNRAVEYCEPDETIELQDVTEEIAALEKDDWKRSMIGYSYAQKHGITGKGVRIGIIDSGLAPAFSEHSAATIEKGYNYIDKNEDTTDSYGHGTFVASVIAHEDLGIAGEVSIVPLKAFSNKSSAVSNIVAAIYKAADSEDYPCDVINMSFASGSDYDSLRTAIEYVVSKGIIVVASAGNGGSTALTYPAGYDGVIGVGSLDAKKVISLSSQRNTGVFLAAPGVSVRGMDLDGSERTGSGTSYSAPLVTAAAALAMQRDPKLTTEKFTKLLRQSAEDLGTTGWDSTYGWGLLNVGLMLAIEDRDMQSLIFSAYSDEICVSFAEEANEKNEIFMALYSSSGQMLKVRGFACGPVSNAKLVQNTHEIGIMLLQSDTKQLVKAR